jgi:hypothetical protein
VEIRNPKAEVRKKAEIRSPKGTTASVTQSQFEMASGGLWLF